jgi:CSLREA domain-containing protein
MTHSRFLPLAVALPLGGAPAQAGLFTVDTTADAVDAVLDGTCADALGRCALRAAIQEANHTPGELDTILLPAGVYKLTVQGAGEDLCATGDLDVTGPLSIDGGGAEVTRIQGRKDRVLDVFSNLIVEGATVTKGKVGGKNDAGPDFNGGGIRNQGQLELLNAAVTKNAASDDGGGIVNVGGTLSITSSTVSGNKAGDDAGGIEVSGGTVLLQRVTISGNKAKGDAGGLESEGGGIVNAENVTVSGNKAGEGSGVNSEGESEVALIHATVTRNKSKEGGALNNEGFADPVPSTLSITNSIVAGNKTADCFGTITSAEGGNIEGGTSCGLTGAEDLDEAGTKVVSKKLADNGGSTRTHAIEAGSPAVDFGVPGACIESDQRELPRFDDPAVAGGPCDSGAFELQGP